MLNDATASTAPKPGVLLAALAPAFRLPRLPRVTVLPPMPPFAGDPGRALGGR